MNTSGEKLPGKKIGKQRAEARSNFPCRKNRRKPETGGNETRSVRGSDVDLSGLGGLGRVRVQLNVEDSGHLTLDEMLFSLSCAALSYKPGKTQGHMGHSPTTVLRGTFGVPFLPSVP